MAFDAVIRHWPNLDAFTAYLQGVPRPAWCKRITNHNTYIPNESQWRGVVSVEGCKQTYIGKGWTSGPHLFCAAEAPHPAHRGIFQLTPITHQGTHAGPCNADALGVEHVGDFDARPPTAAQYQLLLGVNRALLHRWGITPDGVNVHNECMAGRTCPGRHLTGMQIRNDLRNPLPTRPPLIGRYVIVAPCAVFISRSPSAPLAGGANQVQLQPGDVVNVGDVTDGWLWVSDKADTDPGIGFLPSSYARPVL